MQQVAADLGYASSSSVTMLRKALGTSPARYMAHRQAAQSCKDLPRAARAALEVAKKANDAAAQRTTAIGVCSAYRDYNEDARAWSDTFNKHYDKEGNRVAMEAMPGGRHGDTALRWFIELMVPIKAPPGFSNHSNGLAVDFSTTVSGVTYGADTDRRAQWRGTWLHPWLVANAKTYRFNPLSSEEWHLGLDLSSRIFRVASLLGLACSPLPAQQATLPLEEPPRQRPIRAERSAAISPAAAEEALVKNQLFLLQSARAELVLRGYGSKFEHQLASKAQHVLYDAELELVWFSGERRLWVVDLRESTLAAMLPVLIASNVPHHVEIHVDRGGTDFVEPQDACDLAPFVQLHWTDQPWIEGERGQRLTELDGHAWLARERSRLARAPGEERWFHPSGSHVALPSARAHCEDAERCGAALPFTPPSWGAGADGP